MKRRVLAVTVAAGVLCAGVMASAANAAVAPGAPGAQSYFDLARKDCVGTARNTTSRVWFTVADGVLSDTYWPNVDATNVHTLQYVVTDGSTFTDLQTRDMTYRVVPDPSGMSCTIVASSAAHHYSITTTYIADPARDAVLMRTRFRGPAADQVYVRLDPLAGGTGGGGSQNAGANSAALVGSVPVDANPNTVTDATNRDYAVPTYEALQASHGFGAESVGYEGTASDGLTMLDASHSLTTYDSAPTGHVALTAQLRLRHGRSTNLALGFGQTQAAAIATAGASADQRFARAWRAYEGQWARYDAHLRRPARSLGRAVDDEYYASVNVVKASEDKQFPGAIAAGLDSPWGQSVPAGNLTNGEPTYFGSYREVFARDLYEAFTGLLVAGDVRTAQDATRFLFDDQQQSDGSMPRNSLENGKPAPDTGGVQLDETSYPILMDWQSGLAGDHSLYTEHVVPAADFLIAHGPSDGVERWEEQTGYSPSTIAAEIAGLTAAAKIATINHDPAHARLYQATADDFARNIKAWTVTSTGPYSSKPYFIRVSKTGDPNIASPYALGNGNSTPVDQRSVVDAGFLELVRLGILPARDPDIRTSLGVIDKTIEAQTDSGPGFYRYGTSAPGSEDGYGDCVPGGASSCSILGAPWPPTDTGTGHLWPVLNDERAEYDLNAGQSGSARSLLGAMLNMTSGQGLEPEQVWEDPNVPPSPFGTDPTTASIGFTNGKPVGSASPLTWAQSTVARLTIDLGAGRTVETPDIVSDRYVAHGMPGTFTLTIATLTPDAAGTSATVTGTTLPGADIDAETTPVGAGQGTLVSTVADGHGNWTVTLPWSFGASPITVTATKGDRTAYAQASSVTLPGTNVFSTTDPTDDDNGPGTYQYPTAADFTAGSFDLTAFKVNQTATNVYLQISLRDLAPTFGSNFGAQMLDIYARDPSVGSTSTSSAIPQENYSIASADAWTERVEAQGFAPVQWVNAANASLGSAQLVADPPSGTATIVLPRAAFGTVGPGWTFTVALTGQDGTNPTNLRAFTQPAGAYTFGVCPVGNTDPICAVDPDTVPKVMDTITPAGVSQATELNPLNGPVQLQGVTVP
ncbi:MAG TPA: glucodextranase DOMON-like domain-containing protein [Solirubrobacteraceae bacterium]|nr:glucodextranase DOMON-like domain-containing protein [Solirubrobacteraceae bacterium]